MSLQDFIKIIVEKISEIKKSIVELTGRVDKLKAKESNKMLAETMINHQNVNVISLRTGKQVQDPEGAQKTHILKNVGPSEPSPETTLMNPS